MVFSQIGEGGCKLDKIAVISDIHGNLTALEAVLNDIAQRGIRLIVCLGDIVGKGPRNKEVLDRCTAACKTIVKGNWDDFVSRENYEQSVSWYRNQLGREGLLQLKELPEQITFFLSGQLVRLFHAHPTSLFKRVYFNGSPGQKEAMFEVPTLSGATVLPQVSDLVGYGDIHHAYIESFSMKTLFNCGSVGNPLDLTQASYAILEGLLGSRSAAPYSISFCRVQYDIEQEIQIATESGMPFLEPYINELRTAKYSRY